MDEQSMADMRARLRQWRQEHPRATFDEIEEAVQAEVVRWQAQLVEDVIQAGAADTDTEAHAKGREAPPVCASCGTRMQRGGRRRRELLTRLGQAIELERDYSVCPACGAGLFPLDEVLGLSGSRYSPRVQSWLVRLGAELPFARAAFWLEELAGVALSAATVRRHTEAVGAQAVADAEAEVERLEREVPVPPHARTYPWRRY